MFVLQRQQLRNVLLYVKSVRSLEQHSRTNIRCREPYVDVFFFRFRIKKITRGERLNATHTSLQCPFFVVIYEMVIHSVSYHFSFEGSRSKDDTTFSLPSPKISKIKNIRGLYLLAIKLIHPIKRIWIFPFKFIPFF